MSGHTWIAFGAVVVLELALVSPCMADVPDFTFDDEASISDWVFEFGGVKHAEKFSTDDAGGKKDSGSLEVELTFPASDGEQKGAYTYSLPEPIDLSEYESAEFDMKVVEGSATDSLGDNGYLTLAVRNTANNDWSEQYGDAVRIADGWRNISTPISGEVNDARGLTIQLWGGPDQNIEGTVKLRIDNMKLIKKKTMRQ